MTLWLRLSIATVIFGLIAFFTVKWLYPKPEYTGEYQAANARGAYLLRILDRETAVMIYTDKAGRKFAYRGQVMPNNGALSVSWTDQLKNDEWAPLQAPLQAKLKQTRLDEITTAEGTFKRVPPSFWRRWFTY